MYLNHMSEQWSAAVKERVGSNIRRLRMAKGWSQNHLGDVIGVPCHTIQKWEQGSSAMGVDRMIWMCKCTGWKISDLIKKDGGKNG